MAIALLELLTAWWPVTAVLIVALSWWLARHVRPWPRAAAMLALVLLAPLLIGIEGLVTGCALLVAGERCYWFGFGLSVSLILLVPASALLVAAGAFAARWPRRG